MAAAAAAGTFCAEFAEYYNIFYPSRTRKVNESQMAPSHVCGIVSCVCPSRLELRFAQIIAEHVDG